MVRSNFMVVMGEFIVHSNFEDTAGLKSLATRGAACKLAQQALAAGAQKEHFLVPTSCIHHPEQACNCNTGKWKMTNKEKQK